MLAILERAEVLLSYFIAPSGVTAEDIQPLVAHIAHKKPAPAKMHRTAHLHYDRHHEVLPDIPDRTHYHTEVVDMAVDTAVGKVADTAADTAAGNTYLQRRSPEHLYSPPLSQ